MDREKGVAFDTQNSTTFFHEDLRPLRACLQNDGSRTSRRGDRHQVATGRRAARRLSYNDVALLLHETCLSLVPGEGPLLVGEGRARVENQDTENREDEGTSGLLHEQPQNDLRLSPR